MSHGRLGDIKKNRAHEETKTRILLFSETSRTSCFFSSMINAETEREREVEVCSFETAKQKEQRLEKQREMVYPAIRHFTTIKQSYTIM